MYKANVFWPFTFGMRPFYSVKPAVKLRNMHRIFIRENNRILLLNLWVSYLWDIKGTAQSMEETKTEEIEMHIFPLKYHIAS